MWQFTQFLHPSQPLEVSEDSLTIAKGGSGTVTVSGGVSPYSASTDKTSVVATVDGSTVTIAVDESSTAQSSTVTITDSNEESVTVSVTITE